MRPESLILIDMVKITIDKYIRSSLTFNLQPRSLILELPPIYLTMFFSIATRPIEQKFHMEYPLDYTN